MNLNCPLPSARPTTTSHNPEDLDLEIWSQAADEQVLWTLSEFEYPCDGDGVTTIDPEALAEGGEILDQITHPSASGWRIYSDGTAFHGVRLVAE